MSCSSLGPFHLAVSGIGPQVAYRQRSGSGDGTCKVRLTPLIRKVPWQSSFDRACQSLHVAVFGAAIAMMTSRRYNVEPRPSLRSQGPRELSQRGSVGEFHSATYDRARGSRRRGRPRFAGASLCIGGIRFGLGTFTMEVHEQAAPLSWSRMARAHRIWRAPAGTESDCEISG